MRIYNAFFLFQLLLVSCCFIPCLSHKPHQPTVGSLHALKSMENKMQMRRSRRKKIILYSIGSILALATVIATGVGIGMYMKKKKKNSLENVQEVESERSGKEKEEPILLMNKSEVEKVEIKGDSEEVTQKTSSPSEGIHTETSMSEKVDAQAIISDRMKNEPTDNKPLNIEETVAEPPSLEIGDAEVEIEPFSTDKDLSSIENVTDKTNDTLTPESKDFSESVFEENLDDNHRPLKLEDALIDTPISDDEQSEFSGKTNEIESGYNAKSGNGDGTTSSSTSNKYSGISSQDKWNKFYETGIEPPIVPVKYEKVGIKDTLQMGSEEIPVKNDDSASNNILDVEEVSTSNKEIFTDKDLSSIENVTDKTNDTLTAESKDFSESVFEENLDDNCRPLKLEDALIDTPISDDEQSEFSGNTNEIDSDYNTKNVNGDGTTSSSSSNKNSGISSQDKWNKFYETGIEPPIVPVKYEKVGIKDTPQMVSEEIPVKNNDSASNNILDVEEVPTSNKEIFMDKDLSSIENVTDKTNDTLTPESKDFSESVLEENLDDNHRPLKLEDALIDTPISDDEQSEFSGKTNEIESGYNAKNVNSDETTSSSSSNKNSGISSQDKWNKFYETGIEPPIVPVKYEKVGIKDTPQMVSEEIPVKNNDSASTNVSDAGEMSTSNKESSPSKKYTSPKNRDSGKISSSTRVYRNPSSGNTGFGLRLYTDASGSNSNKGRTRGPQIKIRKRN
ncbi:early transcribed membrane protein, putative [Plasmodium knowlesi strain H]|uniref:Early transcribed membrane protein, putative n=3 Tax=Plasmodium knowlesi TaxID=5850 RepID=A0A5K1UH02_PLAKH|nr:early transcribed membrane protein [Plasmodium knowlesi strain H]OTN68228.1 putative Early transcribed membrane protein [Plasmodium knowlesi]CAA9987230.1 early transcribed membrane protein [Plasmodium knowlesi strain H]SBO23999.1 early transcribed membrane protein, putative [Plasmodium knowlesi strain H]SBO25988.1 early transcribed membrane protein, putative [Plasmodium knowlesi strain H]VVS76704.1 early transcribed membrane protein [Plasmodium knowlesi strain H]|eukprot:XP_002261851.1 early transcribed membrane protein, putative [Plasmodium knowlesi strain H]